MLWVHSHPGAQDRVEDNGDHSLLCRFRRGNDLCHPQHLDSTRSVLTPSYLARLLLPAPTLVKSADAGTGFSCTAVILGGQTLTNVSNGKLPLEASIVLVGFVALILCFVGYNGESRIHS